MTDLADGVLETVSAPGTATFSLGGAPAGRVPFTDRFLTADTPFYFAASVDGTQWECGVGTFTSGSPDLLARSLVTANSLGTTAKVDFQGSVYVYNDIPSAYSLYINSAGGFTPGTLIGIALTSSTTVVVNAGGNASYFATGTMTVSATGVATVAGSQVVMNGTGTTPIVIKHNGTEIARFINGNLCLGCTTDAPLTPSVTEGVAIRAPAYSGALVETYRASGDFFNVGSGSFGNAFNFSVTGSACGSIVLSAGATAYNTTSDYRLKTNAIPLTGAIERLRRLSVRRFNWVGHETEPRVDGMFAHEVAAVVPEAVTGERDAVDAEGKMIPQQMDYSKLVPLLFAAVQEQQVLIDRLLARGN